MSELTLVKRHPFVLSDAESETMRRTLFNSLGGMSADDDKGWKRFWNKLKKAGQGEIFELSLTFKRNPQFHRKMFALFNLGFEAWDPPRQRSMYRGMPVVKNFKSFRRDLVIAAGFYEQTFGFNGRMKLEALSLAYSSMDDVAFERVYTAVCDVLLQGVLVRYKRDELDAVVNKLMEFAGDSHA